MEEIVQKRAFCTAMEANKSKYIEALNKQENKYYMNFQNFI